MSLLPRVAALQCSEDPGAGHSSCPMQSAQRAQQVTGQDGAAVACRSLLFAANRCASSREKPLQSAGPWHRGCSEGTHPTSCRTLLQAEPWQASTDLGVSPPREGGDLLTRITTCAESLCHGHRPQGAVGRRCPSALFHCSKTPAQMQIQACPRADPAQHERDADLSLRKAGHHGLCFGTR